mmetsp:Transcript_10478/g.28976  ORF Transcript_10478/g.28976 Transcript_10478/m.28976 type:complete len:147 (-) Transcript_10478:7-447(-)
MAKRSLAMNMAGENRHSIAIHRYLEKRVVPDLDKAANQWHISRSEQLLKTLAFHWRHFEVLNRWTAKCVSRLCVAASGADQVMMNSGKIYFRTRVVEKYGAAIVEAIVDLKQQQRRQQQQQPETNSLDSALGTILSEVAGGVKGLF